MALFDRSVCRRLNVHGGLIGMALGLVATNGGTQQQELIFAILTGILIFLINFAGYMVQYSTVPTWDQMWLPFWESLLTTLVIYAVNKGIKYSKSEQK